MAASHVVGYARCALADRDASAQRNRLRELGVSEDLIYLDRGMTGAMRERPRPDQVLAAVRAGDTLVAPSLGRLARSVVDAHSIGDLVAERKVVLRLGENEFDPADPIGDMFFRTLGTVADFTSEVQRLRTSEGLAVARAKGKLRGRAPKLSNLQEREVRRMAATGQYTIVDIAEIFNVARSTIYRTFKRADPSAHN